MITCKTCGAELQNPLDRYGETALHWLAIHNAGTQLYRHDLSREDKNGNDITKEIIDTIEMIRQYYFKYHDKYGNRIESIPKKRIRI